MNLSHAFWKAPYEARYHTEIQDRLAADTHHVWNVLDTIVLIILVFMALSLCLRPGGPFHSPRRTGYVSLYLLLIIATVIFLVLHNRYRAKADGRNRTVCYSECVAG